MSEPRERSDPERSGPRGDDDPDLATQLIALERQARGRQVTTSRVHDSGVVDMLQWAFASQAEVRGTQVGPYTLKELRGAGTYGSVWKAIDSRSGRSIALKVPHLNWRSESDVAERYAREAEALGRFSHFNVVPVIEVVRDAGWLALAMDYCEGPSLDRWLSDQDVLPTPEVAAWIVQVLADGINTCHLNGIVHGDIKPANVLLFKPGGIAGFPYEPRITDFGLALLTTESRQSGGSSTLGGTLEYMAPELFRDGAEARTPASDIYALGVLLHVLLTGRTPFSGGSLGKTITRILDEPPKKLSTAAREVPWGLERIVLACLAKAPAARYRTAAELAQDLENFRNGGRVEAPIEGLAIQLARRLRRRERVVEAGILSIAISSALIVWMVIATGMSALGVPWLPSHMTTSRMLRDTVVMSAINLLPIGMAIGFMQGHRWCALGAALLGVASTVLSIGNLTGLITPPFDGVYAADLKLQVVVFSLLTVLFAVQSVAAMGAWWILRYGEARTTTS
jgi:eukaryotic-like serine/threonine-protein kinase